jgi:hypothetical protein
MRELTKEEIDEVAIIWNDISSGRASSKNMKQRAVAFWNKVGNKKYKLSTSCGACLSDVYNGIMNLYNKYYDNT